MKMKNIIKKQQKTIFIGFMSVALFIICICTVCTAYAADKDNAKTPVDIPGLTYDHSMELSYAEEFSVDYYNDGYALITIDQEGQFLVVPEGKKAPKGLEKDITVIQQPLNNIYLVATSAMDLFRAIDGIDSIRLSGTQENGWYIQEAKDAMESGKMIYAGKYNAPDYELILDEGCGLAIESTMIHHNPEVEEKLEQFGIPVMVERSSYESHPLGRTEWMKLYAVLLGKEDVAEKAFKEQTDKLDKVLTSDDKDTGKTVAFFYINSTGAVNVRKNGDYVSNMIELAGGSYALDDAQTASTSGSSVTLEMERFYATAKDADIIVYNGTIDESVATLNDFVGKNALLPQFKAVKNGNVWVTSADMYQQMTSTADIIDELHGAFTGDDASGFHYLRKLG